MGKKDGANETVIYRPYRSHRWFGTVAAVIGLLAFVAAGVCVKKAGAAAFCFGIVGILSLCLTKALYDTWDTVIRLGSDGVIVSRHGEQRCFSREAFSYAYEGRSFKGHLFLVLSPQALCADEVKRLVNRSANFSRVCVASVLVIPLDVLQDTAPVKKWVDEYVVTAQNGH